MNFHASVFGSNEDFNGQKPKELGLHGDAGIASKGDNETSAHSLFGIGWI